MMESARQNLVGFVLNALDHAETIQVEEALAANENLRDIATDTRSPVDA